MRTRSRRSSAAVCVDARLVHRRRPRPYVPERQITYRPIQAEDDGYVSSNTCRACHPAQYESVARVVPPHDDAGRHAGDRPRRFRRCARGPTWQETLSRSSGGATSTGPSSAIPTGEGAQRCSARESPRQIVMITGSHLPAGLLVPDDRTRVLGQLPAMYLIAERRWIPRDAALLHPASRRASVRDRAMERRVRQLSCDQRQATIRRARRRWRGGHAGDHRRYACCGAWHCLRGMSRPGRRARPPNRQPAAPLLAIPDRRGGSRCTSSSPPC